MPDMSENALRHLPSIDQLLRRDGLRDLIVTAGRDAVRDRLREVLAEVRQEVVNANGAAAVQADSEKFAGEIERAFEHEVRSAAAIAYATCDQCDRGHAAHEPGPRATEPSRHRGRQRSRRLRNLEYHLETGRRVRDQDLRRCCAN